MVAILSAIGGGGPDRPVGVSDMRPGGYMMTSHWSPEHTYSIVPPFHEKVGAWLASIQVPEFGVCDSVEQFHELHGRKLDADILPWCAFFVHVAKNPANAGQRGGWRWHKWGEYVGTGTPTREYLDDEPGFDDGVFTFHVYYVDQNDPF